MPLYDFTKSEVKKQLINPPIGQGLHAPPPPPLSLSLSLSLSPLFGLGFWVLIFPMSRYGWDSGSRNMYRFDHVQHRPQNPPQIACRLCDQIFMSSRALINHLESHMTEDGTISATRQQETNLISPQREGNVSINQFQSNLALLTPLQEIRPSIQNCYSLVQNTAVPARNHISTAQFDVPSPQLQLAWSNYMLIKPQPIPSVQPAKQTVIKQLPSDFIKPYIDQLDKPIPEIVDLIKSDNDEKKLDLTLKL